MISPGEVIHAMRQRRGLSQKQLAGLIGATQRQIARYEAGEQLPSLPASDRLAFVLGISLEQLAGRLPLDLDLDGIWYIAWQIGAAVDVLEGSLAYRDGVARMYGSVEGWHGEARLMEQHLAGWFSRAGRIDSGAIFLALNEDWTYATGGWTGIVPQHAGVVRGWSAMARSESQAASLARAMVPQGG